MLERQRQSQYTRESLDASHMARCPEQPTARLTILE
jgi:hypothetical protein